MTIMMLPCHLSLVIILLPLVHEKVAYLALDVAKVQVSFWFCM